MSAISIKQFDTARAIEDTLEIGGVAIDLTECTVKINLYDLANGVMWQRDAEISATPTDGGVSYTPVDDDVENHGDFEFEWEITYPDNTRLTVPTEARNKLTIYPAIIPTEA